MNVTCPHCKKDFEVAIRQTGEIDTPVRSARREKGLTVKYVAAQIDISPFTLQSLERGQMNPRLSTIRALCNLYEKSVDELFPALVEDEEEQAAD